MEGKRSQPTSTASWLGSFSLLKIVSSISLTTIAAFHNQQDYHNLIFATFALNKLKIGIELPWSYSMPLVDKARRRWKSNFNHIRQRLFKVNKEGKTIIYHETFLVYPKHTEIIGGSIVLSVHDSFYHCGGQDPNWHEQLRRCSCYWSQCAVIVDWNMHWRRSQTQLLQGFWEVSQVVLLSKPR